MSSFSGLSKSQVSPLSWTQSNVSISGNSLTGAGLGNAYDAVGFAPLPALGNGVNGYYATVNFNGSGGFAYAGLTQTMTTSDPVDQFLSKIDAGFKCDGGGTILLVYNSSEFGVVIGDGSSDYQVVFDGTNYVYYKDGEIVTSLPALGDNGNGYRAGVAFWDATTVTLTAGTYTGSTIPIPPSEPLDVAVNTETPGSIIVTWNPPSFAGSGVSYYMVQYVATAAPNTVLGSDSVNVNSERTKTFTGISGGTEYVVKVTAYNANENASQPAEFPITTPTWDAPSAPRDVAIRSDLPHQVTVSWKAPVSAGLQQSFSSYNIYIKDAGSDSYSHYNIPHDNSITTYEYTQGDIYVGVCEAYVTSVNGSSLEGTATQVVNTSVDAYNPGAPTITSVDTSVAGKATVNWVADGNVPLATSFRITVFLTGTGTIAATATGLTGTSAELTLSAGTYDIVVRGITTLGGYANSTTYSGAVVSGGGGGGGGGGNNGGTGYNNMACSLEFSYTGYTGGVNQTNVITVLGEDGGSLSYDQLITVHVTPEELSNVIAYESNWAGPTGDEAGEQPLPNVKFLPVAACGTRLEEMYALLRDLGTGAAASDARKFTDSTAGDIPKFGDILLGLSFPSGSWLDDDEMPRESIRSIAEGTLSGATHFATSDADSVVKDLDSTVNTDEAPLLKSLFEQAIVATSDGDVSRILTSNVANPHAAGYSRPNFQAGDSITFLVKYTFDKTRDYIVDSDVGAPGGGANAAKYITVNGVTYEIVSTDESAEQKPWTYAIKLLAASPVVAPANKV